MNSITLAIPPLIAILIVLIHFHFLIYKRLPFTPEKKSEYVRKNEGKAIWSPDLGTFIYHVIDNKYMFSKNGEDWKELILPKISKNKGEHICYSSVLERFVIILGSSVYSSIDGITWTEECLPSKEEIKEDAKEVYNLINELRNKEEGNKIIIYHDNFDSEFDEHGHNNRIDFSKGFDDYQTVSFFGSSLKECLQLALKQYKEGDKNETN